MLLVRFDKFRQVLMSWRLLSIFIRRRVLVGAEHRNILDKDLATVIDIGANRGQFTLAVRHWSPRARVIAFEPLPGPADVLRTIFAEDEQVICHQLAIGPGAEYREMHVSARDDSSSLLPISSLQHEIFPGTEEISTVSVQVVSLDMLVKPFDIKSPALLKLDVQGFEYEALLGCESMLPLFDQIYCECSFIELYAGQRLAADVIGWLALHSFRIVGMYNTSYDDYGRAVQADFLFRRG